jgi:raffinose/stachyose/melibiose transport system substrate-binding protein
MRFRRKNTLAVVSVAVGAALALTLTGCGTGTGSTTGGNDTLRVQVGAGTGATAMKKVADDFEKANPGVTVTLEAVDADASRAPNAALLSSSTAPDVGYLQRSTGVWSTLIKNDELLPLDDVWKKNDLASKYAPSQVSYYTTKGKHFGVLYDELLVNPVYYNVDAFKKAGISAPKDHRFTSLSQFEGAAAALKKAGYGGLGVGGSSAFDLGHTFDALLPTAVSAKDYASLLTNFKPGQPTTVKYTDPGVVSALSTIASWQKKGVYQDGMLGMDDTKAGALFTGGSIGMVQGGTYSWANITAAKPTFKVGWALMPPLTAGRQTPFDAFNGDTFVVPKKAAHPALAKKFLEFFMTDKYQSTVIPASGSLPVFQNVDASKLSSLGKAVQQMYTESKKEGGVVNIWDSTVPTSLGQTFTVPILQQVVAGKLTPEQAAQKMQTALEALQSGKVSSDTD